MSTTTLTKQDSKLIRALAKRKAEDTVKAAGRTAEKHIGNAKKNLVFSINHPYLLSDAVCKRLSDAFDSLSAAQRNLEALQYEIAEERAAEIAPGLVIPSYEHHRNNA